MKKRNGFVFLFKFRIEREWDENHKPKFMYALHKYVKWVSKDPALKPKVVSDKDLDALYSKNRNYCMSLERLLERSGDDDEYVVCIDKTIPHELFKSKSRALLLASVLGFQVYEFKGNDLPNKMTFGTIRKSAKIAK